MLSLSLAAFLLLMGCDKKNPVAPISVPPSFDSKTDIEANVDAYVNHYVTGNRPGVAVMVIKDDTITLKKGYGLANIERQLPFKLDTPCFLASVSKQFTAMAIMILAERGKLAYEDKLKAYIPEIPASWNAITIHHLLTHQSGMFDYANDLGWFDGVTDSQVLDSLARRGDLEFSPGTKYDYSNSGYVILAILVERVSGRRFRVFVKENIFDPLGMNKSLVYDESKPEIPDRAIGYRSRFGVPVLNDWNMLTTGAGGLVSTIEDLYKWDQSLYTERIVSKETLARAYTRHVGLGNGFWYGYGWGIGNYNGLTNYQHNGGHAGFRTQISRFPEARFTVLILSNGTYDWIFDLHDEIVRYYLR